MMLIDYTAPKKPLQKLPYQRAQKSKKQSAILRVL
jgi:hypothetical protein